MKPNTVNRLVMRKYAMIVTVAVVYQLRPWIQTVGMRLDTNHATQKPTERLRVLRVSVDHPTF
jgi:hypothetical protein